MSIFGANYKINGHRTGDVLRSPLGADMRSEFKVRFERCFAENTLEAIESIDWQTVTTTTLRPDYPACILPEGYSYTVENIEYERNNDAFVVTLILGKQHYGDVTAYQSQIDTLTETVAQKDSALTEKEEALTAANALLAEIEEAYDAN